MAETTLRRRVVRALRCLNAYAVENSCLPGTPDVATTLCKIELKKVDRPPVRSTTAVDVPTYTRMQRDFARDEHKAGGVCWLLIQIGSEMLLLYGDVARKILATDDGTLENLRKAAEKTWDTIPSDKELLMTIRDRSLRRLVPRWASDLSSSEGVKAGRS